MKGSINVYVTNLLPWLNHPKVQEKKRLELFIGENRVVDLMSRLEINTSEHKSILVVAQGNVVPLDYVLEEGDEVELLSLISGG